MSKISTKPLLNITKVNHLATGGDLVLPITPDRTQRTQMRSMRAKRIEVAFSTRAPALNWENKKG